MKSTIRSFRLWTQWNWPYSLRRWFCAAGWHYWRHNTLYMGAPAGLWLRMCEDCGQWQELNGKMRWQRKEVAK